MRTLKIQRFLYLLLIVTGLLFIYYTHLQKNIVGQYVDAQQLSVLTFQEKNYYMVINADQFNFDKKLGYIVGNKDSIGLFDHKESVHSVDNLDTSEYIAVSNLAIMEEIKILYVSDEVNMISIHLYENLAIDKNKQIFYKNIPYFLYLQENPDILKAADKLSTNEQVEIYQFQDVSDEEWLLVKDIQTNTVAAYCRDIDYLTGVPTSVYQFEIN